MKKIFFLLLFIYMFLPSKAVTIGNLSYTISNGEATVEGPGEGVTSITNLVIPDNIEYNGQEYPVTVIGFKAFYDFSNNLTGTLKIGKNIREISGSAFWGCSGLTGVLSLPASLTSIGASAFRECKGFNGNLYIPQNVTTISNLAFSSCYGFDALKIDGPLTTLNNGAFFSCGFTEVILPASVTTIERNAFQLNKQLKKINLGDLINLESIGMLAFDACYVLESIGDIGNCKNLKSIGNHAFSECPSLDGVLNLSGFVNLEEILDGAFDGCSSLKSINLSGCDKLTKVPSYAFASCTSLISIDFSGCTRLETIEFCAFTRCISLLSIDLSQLTNLTSMGESMFDGCTNLESVIFPESMESLGLRFFRGCNNLTTVVCYALNPPKVGISDGDSPYLFSNSEMLKSGTLYVPAESLNLYKEDKNWGMAFRILPIGMAPSSITLNVEEMALFVGQTDKLIAKVEPADTTEKIINWESDNEAVATVEPDGTVSAVSVGTANITASCGTVSATCKVTVNPVIATGVTLNVQDMTLTVGQNDQLKATVTPPNTTNQTITWESDNEAVATVASDGTVTAVSVGIANITASCGTASATCNVTVIPVIATGVTLNVQDMTLIVGQSDQLKATVTPPNTTNQTITWKSDNEAVATVASDGTVTAVSVGTANITATCGTTSATCKVIVESNIVEPTEIILNIKDMVLYIGQSETIQAIVRPPNTTNPTVTWSSDNESVATVSADGKVTGISEGSATITAICRDVTATCTVTVNPIPASNIVITNGDITLTIGSSTVMNAKVSPDNTTHPEVDWLSSDPNIASISADGTVVAVNIGTAIVTAKCGNVSATSTVTVIPVPSEGIVLSPTSVTMLLGEQKALEARVYPENTTDKNINWGSDNPAVASVTSEGVVTALGIGTATITASNGSSKATCSVTVNPVVATSISLNVKDETIFVASSTQLMATIDPDNVTDKTITWTSSRPEIATVSDQGLVYGVSVGTTTITAKIGDVSTTCQINVVHRIPDMDPSVTTSDRDIKTLSGMPVNMAVYAQGGEPTGWSYIWTNNGNVVSQSGELNITAKNDSQTVIAETYRVKVENEIDKVVIFSEVFDFVVQIYPSIEDVTNGGEGGDNGITISTGNGSMNKIREGNKVTLSVATPKGGNPQGWEYLWSSKEDVLGGEDTIEILATMSAGNTMGIETSLYSVEMSNYGPDGDTWAQFNLSTPLDVYRRPQTPLQMLRKGDGSSHTFIVMMSLSNAQITDYSYRFVYGYTDSRGEQHILEETPQRYCHTTEEVYWNSENKFWVYSVWHYTDGSTVSSGIRYLDGSSDEEFDASTFDGTGESNISGRGNDSISIYTLDGQYIGSERQRLAPGIYIRHTVSEGVARSEKFIVR